MQKTSTPKKKAAAKHQGRNAGTPKAENRNSATATHKPNREARSKGGDQSQGEESKLKEFFIDELKDIYWAEKKLVKTLPKLQKAATSTELKEAFANHLTETEGHVQRLEKIFGLLGEKAQAKKCDAMEGITEEGSSVIEDTDKGTATRDVGLVMAGQKAEHYEIATYGSLIQIAKTLGLEDVAGHLADTLKEEKAADQKLTTIAESNINYTAAGEKE